MCHCTGMEMCRSCIVNINVNQDKGRVMSNTDVFHRGTDRNVRVTMRQWEVHEKVIRAYCDGVAIQCDQFDVGGWVSSASYSFGVDVEYRIKPAEPVVFEGYVKSAILHADARGMFTTEVNIEQQGQNSQLMRLDLDKKYKITIQEI